MDPGQPAKKQRGALFYVLLGCGGLALLIVIGFVVMGLLAARAVKGFADGFTDPAAKKEAVTQMMGAVPQGYTPAITLNLLMVHMAVLVDAPAPLDGGVMPDEFDRMFLYMDAPESEKSKALRAFVDGTENDVGKLRDSNVNVDAKEILKRGTAKSAGGDVKYVVLRGTVDFSNTNASAGQKHTAEGISTLMHFVCKSAGERTGIWNQKSLGNDETPAAELKLEGTIADDAEIAKFVQPLNPCGS